MAEGKTVWTPIATLCVGAALLMAAQMRSTAAPAATPNVASSADDRHIPWVSCGDPTCAACRLIRQGQAAAAAPKPGLVVPCQVVGVVDGDTVEVEFTWRTRVRLVDCWTPELKAKEADAKQVALRGKLHLAAIAMNQYGRLQVELAGAKRLGDLFSFDRVIGRVYLDGDAEDLSARQVRAGVAASRKGGELGR